MNNDVQDIAAETLRNLESLRRAAEGREELDPAVEELLHIFSPRDTSVFSELPHQEK